MRWRAPELALVLSDRAVADARRSGDRELRLRAEALALFASNRLGRGVAATERAIAAVRDAETAGDEEVTAELRVELAGCARSSRSHDVALRVLHPVLQRQRVQPEVRAHALIELASALPADRGGSERGAALDEAERLYAAASELSRDTVRLLRARVRAARACHHRRHSEFAAAAEAAEEGLLLLERLGDPDADSGEIRAGLVLERVHAMLELGQRADAVEAAASLLNQPDRAASAGPVGWLRLALATRVHLPQGEHDAAVRLLNDVVAGAERHELGGLLAEALNTLSHVHEQEEDFVEALRCLRSAYAADRRWRMSVYSARTRLLDEFPARAADTSAVDVVVPRQQTTPAPKPAPAPMPAPEPPPQLREEPEPVFPDPGEGSVRDAARRLMDTLTQRAAEQRESRAAQPNADSETGAAGWPRQDSGQHVSSATRADTHHHAQPADAPEPGAAYASADSAAHAAAETVRPETAVPAQPEPTRQHAADSGTDADSVNDDWPIGGRRGRRAAEEVPEPFGTPASSGLASAQPEEISTRDWAVTDTGAAGWPKFSSGDYSFAGSSNAEQDQSRTDHAGEETSRPDVTAIMPVIAVPAKDDPAPADTPAEQRHHAAEAEAHSPSSQAEPEIGEHRNGAAQDEPTGRRSRGKSLAEIRAGLQLVQDHQGRSGYAAGESTSGQHRPRHAEPDDFDLAAEAEATQPADGPPAGGHKADEFLAQHRELLESLPPIAVNKEEPPAAPPADAGLADLLAEALMAYENGRRQSPASRASGQSIEDFDTPVGPARHRRAVGDSMADNPRSWTPRN